MNVCNRAKAWHQASQQHDSADPLAQMPRRPDSGILAAEETEQDDETDDKIHEAGRSSTEEDHLKNEPSV